MLDFAVNRFELGLKPHIIFYQYLLPSGIGNLWGILNLSYLPTEPWLSITIATGFILLTFIVLGAIRLSWQGEPIAIMTLVMLTISLLLFFKNSGYGLFKLAMYIQPFLIATTLILFSELMYRSQQKRIYQGALILCLASGVFMNLRVQFRYLNSSIQKERDSAIEVASGTTNRLYKKIQDLLSKTERNKVLVHTNNRTVVGMSALASKKKATFLHEFQSL